MRVHLLYTLCASISLFFFVVVCGGGRNKLSQKGMDTTRSPSRVRIRTTGGADERADDCQERRPEHEALRAERPARVGVEHRDDHRLLFGIAFGLVSYMRGALHPLLWYRETRTYSRTYHVRPADGRGHVRAERPGERRAGAEARERRLGGARHAEADGAVWRKVRVCVMGVRVRGFGD